MEEVIEIEETIEDELGEKVDTTAPTEEEVKKFIENTTDNVEDMNEEE